jgi:hypothetical protein
MAFALEPRSTAHPTRRMTSIPAMLHAKRLVSSKRLVTAKNLLHDLGSRREELGETISSMDRIPGNALLIIL